MPSPFLSQFQGLKLRFPGRKNCWRCIRTIRFFLYQTARLYFCPHGWECWIWGVSHYRIYLRWFFSLEISKCGCSLQQQLVFLLPPSLLPVVHMETNTDVFKAFHLKYLLKSVWLGALNLPLSYKIYTKQQKKLPSGILRVVEIPYFLMWGRFRIFSLSWATWESFQHRVLDRWILTAPPGDFQNPWSLKCCKPGAGAVPQLLEYCSVSVLLTPWSSSTSLKMGDKPRFYFGFLPRTAVISLPPHSEVFPLALFSSSFHLHNQRAFFSSLSHVTHCDTWQFSLHHCTPRPLSCTPLLINLLQLSFPRKKNQTPIPFAFLLFFNNFKTQWPIPTLPERMAEAPVLIKILQGFGGFFIWGWFFFSSQKLAAE